MSAQDKCATCNHDDLEHLEDLGRKALDGEISWRAAAREAGFSHHQGLKNHMERHYAPVPTQTEQALTSIDAEVAQVIAGLKEEMAVAPPSAAALYAAAIRNLAGIEETKPSQQHLIQSLKAIHEITGMRMEQQLMLEFAKHHFGADEEEVEQEMAEDVIDV